MNRTTRVLLLVVASGIPAALVWLVFARPSQWQATERGLVLTESAARGQFQVVAVFTVVGLVVGLVAGALVHRLTGRGTWRIALALTAAVSMASLVCWRLGVRLGPGALQDAAGLEVGDAVPAPLLVDALPPFLVWPLSAVLAYTLSLYLSSDGADREAEMYGDLGQDQPLAGEVSGRFPQ